MFHDDFGGAAKVTLRPTSQSWVPTSGQPSQSSSSAESDLAQRRSERDRIQDLFASLAKPLLSLFEWLWKQRYGQKPWQPGANGGSELLFGRDEFSEELPQPAIAQSDSWHLTFPNHDLRLSMLRAEEKLGNRPPGLHEGIMVRLENSGEIKRVVKVGYLLTRLQSCSHFIWRFLIRLLYI